MMTSDATRTGESFQEQIVVAGAGVVGSAIAVAHLKRNVPIFLLDIHESAIAATCERIQKMHGFHASATRPFISGGYYCQLSPQESNPPHEFAPTASGMVIESIAERLDVKRAFFESTSRLLGRHFVMASNTSSLRLSELESACMHPENFCGLHFFMPIEGRDIVEVVRSPNTSNETLDRIAALAARLGKQVLHVKDSPAMVVNRILTPFLNQGLALLGQGAKHDAIRAASRSFGMPRSPLEMVDMIGTRTAFDAGRVAWQAFPTRVEPSPILPGLIKAGLTGWAGGEGFYAYGADTDQADPSQELTDRAASVIDRYQRDVRRWTDRDILLALSIPMWIEACCILQENIVDSTSAIEVAMEKGLGFLPGGSFFESFERIGAKQITDSIVKNVGNFKAMSAPPSLIDALNTCHGVRQATETFARTKP
jgi:3-hydroxyacyl-CoA dehydrogenase / enoyl-CoA hydratase / 3-hydroxybutyryl-CoA epimerase / enoyl-CoA isomerase